MPPDPTDWESRLSQRIGVACAVAVADPLGPLIPLTPEEKRRVERFGGSPRADSYRLGRCALKALRTRLGEDPEEPLAFPHSRFSVTHSGSVAIAFGIRARQTQTGAGIDYEDSAEVSREAERFFLAGAERRWLRELGGPAARRQRLRLWTVKEALFKADLDNAQTFLRDYALADPSADSGWAKRVAPSARRARPRAWRYACLEVEGGFLTAAVRVEGRNP